MSLETLFRSRLFFRLFSTTATIICLSFAGVYFFAVPYIQDTVERREAEAARTILNIVHEQVELSYQSLEHYRRAAVENKQHQLRVLLKFLKVRAQDLEQQTERKLLTQAQARKRFLDDVASIRQGRDDYVFAIGHDNTVLSHPDRDLIGINAADIRDAKGNLIAPSIIEIAQRDGEGFFSYWWPRLGDTRPTEKLAFVLDIAPFQMAIVSALFVDDIDEAMQSRKEDIIKELRKSLNTIRIARTGYIFIYDDQSTFLIHPTTALEGTNPTTIIEPRSKKPILELLNKHVGTKEGVQYVWNTPADPSHYIYDKVAWLRHHDGFDWIIGASVYQEELNETAITLRNRVLIVLLVMLMVSIGLIFLLSRMMSIPLHQLLDTARQVSSGNLSARCPIAHPDEIGTVADAFNSMLEQLQIVVKTLDEKNNALNETVDKLQQAMNDLKQTQDHLARSQRMAALGVMVDAIAHEMNTPLGISLTVASLIDSNVLKLSGQIETGLKRSELTQNMQELHEAAVLLERNLHRAAGLINDFKDIAIDQSRLERSRFLLDALVSEICQKALPALPSPNHIIEHEIPPDILLDSYPSLLEQVVLHLVDNAIRHGFEGRDAGTIRITAEVLDAQHIQLSVKDNGVGINARDLARVFDPFFTTKMGRGSKGIGLSSGHNIVTVALGGSISVESTPGKETCFTLRIPIIAPSLDEHAVLGRNPAPESKAD